MQATLESTHIISRLVHHHFFSLFKRDNNQRAERTGKKRPAYLVSRVGVARGVLLACRNNNSEK